jgi:flagellar biosynthesis/type III secretory pathway protein FliH
MARGKAEGTAKGMGKGTAKAECKGMGKGTVTAEGKAMVNEFILQLNNYANNYLSLG